MTLNRKTAAQGGIAKGDKEITMELRGKNRQNRKVTASAEKIKAQVALHTSEIKKRRSQKLRAIGKDNQKEANQEAANAPTVAATKQ